MSATTPTRCMLCQGTLEAGFILDHAHGPIQVLTEKWGAGKPEPSFWTVTKKPKRTHTVQAYRCTGCGFLMQFARPDSDAR